jgi:hypothetical protein
MKTFLIWVLIRLSKKGRSELPERWDWLMKVHDRGLAPCSVRELEQALAADWNRKGDSK